MGFEVSGWLQKRRLPNGVTKRPKFIGPGDGKDVDAAERRAWITHPIRDGFELILITTVVGQGGTQA